MIGRRAAAGLLAGLGLAGLGLYANRRLLLERALGLRPAEYAVRLQADLAVQMPDGVILYADLISPQAPGTFPTILIRTPYGRPSERAPAAVSGLIKVATRFAERGYHVLVQSVRGRFGSQGIFEPFVNEAADGLATLAWIAQQSWFDGNLGMWGASYVGYTQWAVAAEAPPFLKAIVPINTTARFSRTHYPGGSFAYESTLRWCHYLHTTTGVGAPVGLPTVLQLLDPRREAALRSALATTPFAAADQAAFGAPAAPFRQWLSDPDPDGPYWRRVDHHRNLNQVAAAVHLVAVWHDLFLAEQLADYTDLLAAHKTPCLTVVPGHHTAVTSTITGLREGLWWFDAHLKGQRDLLKRRPVSLHLQATHERHVMDFWPPPARPTSLFLQPAGGLALEPQPAGGRTSYRYDPHQPTPAIGGPVLSPAGGERDQRPLEARADLICFTSDPLEADLDLIGYPHIDLFVRSSQPYFDLVGRLCAVTPAGQSINRSEGILRVAPGMGEVQADGCLRLTVDLAPIAARFHTGQRLRLQIASAAHPRWAANSGDGRPLSAGAPAGPPSEQTIFHDQAHPSALVLPVVSDETRRMMAADTPVLAGLPDRPTVFTG
ncbi:MAG: CocE/NonD family hydrolase [Oscillochloridaceae bacterium umkhey_bin13]